MMSRRRYLDDELCDCYREANLRFPQVEVGIVPLVGDLMLRGGVDYLADSLTLEFSPPQVSAIREGMNRAHNARGIPALSPGSITLLRTEGVPETDERIQSIRVISDERIRAVWRNIVFYTIDAMVDCVLAVRSGMPLPDCQSADGYQRLSAALPMVFARDPALLEQVSGMFAATVRALESEEARRLAREFRDALDFHDIQSGRKALLHSRRLLHQALAELLLRHLRAEHMHFAPLVQSQGWRIFRPMMSN